MPTLAGVRDVQALVPGRPERVVELARQLAEVEDGLSRAAVLLETHVVSGWSGSAATAALLGLTAEPERYRRTARAAGLASAAVAAHARVLAAAQEDVAVAVQVATRADVLSASWRAEPPTARTDIQDPGAVVLARGQQLVDAARGRVRASGAQAADAVRRAARAVPTEPTRLQPAAAWARGVDGSMRLGAVEAVAELVTLAMRFTSPRALTDPWGYSEDVHSAAVGVLEGLRHPADLLRTVTDWDTWQEDPARALGRLLPDLVVAVATFGAGTGLRATRVAARAEQRAWAARGLAELSGDAAAVGWRSRFGYELSAGEVAALRAFRADKIALEARTTAVLARVVRRSGGRLTGLEHAVKSEESLCRKLGNLQVKEPEAALDEQLAQIKDGLRYSVVVEPEHYARETLDVVKALSERLEWVGDRNSWGHPAYQGVNTTWRTTSGDVIEVQFHTPESLSLKEATHELYDLRSDPAIPRRFAEELTRLENDLLAQAASPDGITGRTVLRHPIDTQALLRHLASTGASVSGSVVHPPQPQPAP